MNPLILLKWSACLLLCVCLGLKEAPPEKERQTGAYTDPTLPLAPALVPAIAGFLHKVAKD
ncbi:hypothetical protein F2P44_24915 [Massilia sp. CCM 8695]|uniref:Uncharacterized protein n=1 Tax=Massilia frigida TaxID=2609281 RepID=A0ABX0NGC0_9BURK|nr:MULTISPECIES: hypothetical protein [Massilia]MDM5180881.1 hypothetical protein [Massilia sp. DJPM01]NHZ82496.1 hypothetical protein [Massilia frigida]